MCYKRKKRTKTDQITKINGPKPTKLLKLPPTKTDQITKA